MAAQKFAVPLGGGVPAGILYKAVITAQVHREQLAAVRAVGDKLGRDIGFQDGILRHGQLTIRCEDIPLCFYHLPDECLIVESLLTAWFTALEQAVIALRVEQPLFIEPCFLEAVVHIGGDYKVILILHQPEQRVVYRLRGVLIAVDINVPAPVRPVFLHGGVGVEPAGIHIRKAVFAGKIGEICSESFPGVGEPGGGGQPGSCADDDGISLVQGLFELLRL